MYLYLTWKINLELDNKIEIIQISKEPVNKNIKYQRDDYDIFLYYFNNYLDENIIYYTRIDVEVKNPNNFFLYFSIMEETNKSITISVCSKQNKRTKSINWIMRNSHWGNDNEYLWDNKKLNQLKRDKYIVHQYMFNSQITFRIFDLEVNF
jgi:hypothetical protein